MPDPEIWLDSAKAIAPSVGRRATLSLGLTAVMPSGVAAQVPDFPRRPIRVLVPFPPGGTSDAQVRALCEQATKRFGQSVLVENRPGGGLTLAAQALVNETRADGYLLAQVSLTTLRSLATGQSLPFDPRSSFSWIIGLTGYLFGVVVRADRPWRSWAEFLSYAKANPGTLSYGTPGVGTPLHVAMELAAQQERIDWTHIPFRGGAETLQAVLGGQIDAMVDASNWAPLVEEGRLRLLVTFGAERSKRFPEVPTLREAGLDYVSYAPYGIAGPKGMDAGVVRILHNGFREALYDPAHVAVLDRYDMPVLYLGSEDCAAFARRQYEQDLEVVRRLGLRPV